VNAQPFIAEIAAHLERLHFEVVLIGNAAALQGAPVTIVDFDFMFRKTPVNMRNLKDLAVALHATILTPCYPASDLYRVVRDEDGLQLDFMATVHGIRSFAGWRERATPVRFGGSSLFVADLLDIIRSKKAAKRPRDLAVMETLEKTYEEATRARRQTAGVAPRKRSRPVDLIRRHLALPPERRTHFLRKRVVFRGSAL
jgi:hypothetical protein